MSGGRSGRFQLGTSRRFRYRLKASASVHGSESVELDDLQADWNVWAVDRLCLLFVRER
jgi:hypothetical protein